MKRALPMLEIARQGAAARGLGDRVRSRVRLVFAAFVAAFFSSPAGADDIGAAARGVVRVIVVAADSSDPEGGSVMFGSGFAVSPHRIVTNAHVVEAARNPFVDSVVAIVPAEGKKAVRGEIVAYDPSRDLAVVDVGDIRLEPLAIYSGPVDPGKHSAALGYPGNVDLATAESMYDIITPSSPVRSEGNVSSERRVDGRPALLHTAAISRGNSGGPLVDECGRVIGVNTYTTRSESGDAPFGFAIISQELLSFLRDQGEKVQQVGTACVSMAEQAQRERQAQDNAARANEIAQQRAAREQQARMDEAKAAIEDSRVNHMVGSSVLAFLSLLAMSAAALSFFKDRAKAAGIAAVAGTIGITLSAYTFVSRPSFKVDVPTVRTTAVTAPLAGKLLCRVRSDLSRITVSSTDDLAMTWDGQGCMNGRTLYVGEGDLWRRVLVPNGSETVAVQEFNPATGEYKSTRYLLAQSDMERLRSIRGSLETKSCALDTTAERDLQQVTEQLISALPSVPNERLIYSCSQSRN